MVEVAQVLAREPHVMLLDEHTCSLDLQRQLDLLDTAWSVARGAEGVDKGRQGDL